jgi:hypothetical protein
MAEDNFYSEYWRCSLGNTRPLAPLVWFLGFAALFAVVWPLRD